ncbi:MAG: hypothetical protein K0R45_1230 [Pseudomonas sp.]|nr:hypothetical protein [Pseudomonas sp.]
MPQADSRQADLDVALDWLLRVSQAPEDTQLQARFDAWRDAAPEHAEALGKAEHIWKLTGHLAPATAHKWPAVKTPNAERLPAAVPPPHVRQPRRRPLRWAIGGALAACLVATVGPNLNTALQSDFQTAQGERRDVELPDGSRAVLDADSAIAVDFTDAKRDIRLLRGQVFFEVQPDRERPFNVRARELDVTVTGTAFNVDLESKTIAVAVQHGSVTVTEHGSRRLLSPGLTAGQRLNFEPSSHQARLDSLPASRVATWRKGQLIADNARLGDMVAALQRYLPGAVWVKDAQLAELRITGVYDTGNPQAALRAMAQPHGVKLENWTPWVTVLTR